MKIIITENQHRMLESSGELDELRGSYLNYVDKKVEDTVGEKWPKYVIHDWLYASTKNFDPNNMDPNVYKTQVQFFVNVFKNRYGEGHWEFKDITLNFESLSEKTKSDIEYREWGKKEIPYIKNDKKRFKTQSKLMKDKGISSEPIIVINIRGKYTILEGWHRSITYLKKYGEYVQPAYVYMSEI